MPPSCAEDARLITVPHADWCPRDHPETADGQTYLALDKHWLTGHYPYLDHATSEALLHALQAVATENGTRLMREMTDDGPRTRLCTLWRVRQVQEHIAAILRDLSWDNWTGDVIDRVG